MGKLYQVWAFICNASRTTNLAIIIGSTFFILTIMLIFLFLSHDHQTKELESVVRESRIAAVKMRYYSELADYANMRTRLTSKIINTEDIFEQDELNQELEIFAGKYAGVNLSLRSLPLSTLETKILKQQALIVPVILPAQRKVVSLAMNGDNASRKKASKLLYDIVFPGQTQLVSLFLALIVQQQQYIDELAVQSKLSFDDSEEQQMCLSIIIVLIFIIIAIWVSKRARSIQIELEQSHENLEARVKERTASLKTARNEAQQSNRAKSEFLSSMSHELRTPMNAILGFSQVLQYDETLTDEQQDSINEILQAGHHLLELINEVLDLAKIESGQLSLSSETVKLGLLVDECFTLIMPVAQQQGITIHHGELNSYSVYADRTRLKQVLLNLLTNAIKYNREQGKVELDAILINDTDIRITIADTGNGISKEKLERLFQPFNRLDAENSGIEGTGIGLSISRNLVELMGGQIGVDSEPGIGSCFKVDLPIKNLLLQE